MTTWFTGDTHFGHANIIKYCNRPFASEAEMNKAIISRWNSKVQKGDMVYHVGDFCFGRETYHFDAFFEQLVGDIILIKGNHDKLAWMNRSKFFASSDSYREISVEGQAITLCHYPLFRWNKSHHFSWMLHGHCHYTLPETKKDAIPSIMGLILDVGVDGNSFYPYSFADIKTIMDKKRHHIEKKLIQSPNDKYNIHETI